MNTSTTMTAALAAAAGATAMAGVAPGPFLRSRARRRLNRRLPGAPPDPVRRSASRPRHRPAAVFSRPLRRWLLPVSAGLMAAAVLGGAAGLVIGSGVAAAAYRWLPELPTRERRRVTVEHDRLLRQVPLTAELLAACLGSSSSPGRAAAAVAESLESPMRERLGKAAAHLALGAPPEACWEQLAVECPPLVPLARCLARTSLSGAPPADVLSGLAQAQRAAAGRAAHARVRRAGVLATAPLGLCFLPAFVLIGVVPVVAGLMASYSHRI